MNNNNINVLVVDDEEALRNSIVQFLEIEDFNVFSSGSPQEALEILGTQEIHFVLSDIRMPHMNGVEFLEEIRKRNPEIPVVVLMTGFSEYSKEEIIAKGARDVLPKPFDFEGVIKMIQESVNTP